MLTGASACASQSNEDEMQARRAHMLTVIESGDELIAAGNLGSTNIEQRIAEVNQQWSNLLDLAQYRKKRLGEAVDYHQVGGGGGEG